MMLCSVAEKLSKRKRTRFASLPLAYVSFCLTDVPWSSFDHLMVRDPMC